MRAAVVGHLLVPAVIGVFAVVFLATIWDMDLESRLYPQLVIAALLLVTGVDATKTVGRWRRDRATAGVPAPQRRGVQPVLRPAYTAVLAVAYVGLGTPQLGFYPATFLFLVCVGAALGLRNLGKLALLGAVPTACCYLVFHEVFALRLPTGPWL
ncbi:MAG: hypothetical protein GEU93_06510 [Propionibacteriales bacterium]|nr:hypothetical protein [Propionibacteriales bacterium]